MLDSLTKNQILVRRCLTKLQLFDIICSEEERQITVNLGEFLRTFQTATAILSGSKYPTLSLVLLFRAEIEQALCDTDSNCVAIGELKKLMRVALPKRLPLDEMHVMVASILDPSQRSLSTLEDYLLERGITTVDILTKYVDKFVDLAQVGGPKEDSSKGEALGKQSAWKKAKLHLLLKQ